MEALSIHLHRIIGHCYLMMDDLQQAYSAYQQALYHLRDPKVSTPVASFIPGVDMFLGAKTLVWHWNSL